MGLRLEIQPVVPFGRVGWRVDLPRTFQRRKAPILEGAIALRYISLRQAAQRRVRPVGLDRGEPVGGGGIPATSPGLSTPLWCGQRGRPRAGAGGPPQRSRVAYFERYNDRRHQAPADPSSTNQTQWRVPRPSSNTCTPWSHHGDQQGARPCSTERRLSSSLCRKVR